ncbi:phage portal protein [Agrobacterium vitis]|uniref:Phage lambdaBa02, DNA replication protein n=3 Tax=Rhizobiaceae TaxID=82115 RepID=B9JSB2_ALLAM|nr:phage lambdaBa02, DNA replication protein [Allorhizobium ampelinum S4]MUO29457.1 phage portal protein [Agrobacterium vitis]MUO42632.1 phage portal protein [Agrobacterium vitis]MUP10601.1 phage portal protein [Agrobacterium vitis]
MKIFSFFRPEKLETRDTSISDVALAALFSGMSSGAGAVSGAEALRVPAVASAVRVISEAAATLEVRIMERDATGSESEDKNHPVGLLLRGDANPWTSGFELIRDLVAGALTNDWGGLAYVNRVGDEIREVIRYQTAAISVQLDPFTGEPTYSLNGSVVSARNIVHVRGPFDRSPLTLAAEAIGAAKIMETHASQLFKNGARPGGVIQTPKSLGDEGVKNMLKAWRLAHEGPQNAGRTALLYDGATFNPMTLNSVDSQFIELRKFQIIEICRAFRIPPSMLYELDRATWSNSEQMGREFLTYTLEPWLRAIEAALGRALLSREDRKRYRILLDRDDLTRADLTARATAISSLISAKVLNPNEARQWLDLGPYKGGDEYGNPHINPSTPGLGHNDGPVLDDEKEPPVDDA